ncbi:unnamed protein product [Paramecium sonneborni]|uniref:Uncharacterized protein n=1 Tax=Paramecium sonneborni TaxID=65129 RepID=A0A8S1KMC5_9CILI|nr:unnamed protein product [Paramecium sonneborni]
MRYKMILSFIALVSSQQVLKQNECNDCGQLKSQTDCESFKTGSCEWIEANLIVAAKCQKKDLETEQGTFKSYCELIEKPEINCSKTLGCAYLDQKCLHFAGCSAYVKTSLQECQQISYRCLSDGTACIEALACKEYLQIQCESTPSISGIWTCKWDNGVCRDILCSEAPLTFTTDEQCDSWKSGCITKGKGCWNKPLPSCSIYTGTEEYCNLVIGNDGNCELARDTKNCKARECSKASNTISTDEECRAYQNGCLTTGKGCYKGTTKPLCSKYFGDNVSCIGYIGSDGVCEGDVGSNKCRVRRCENGNFQTDDQCKEYQKGCVTNGVKCVSSLPTCSTYKGISTGCNAYIGSDGYCTGISTTVEANCIPKTCDQASNTISTDETCEKFQKGCVTTGKGCSTKVALKKCSNYEGDSVIACITRVGSEGKCTWNGGNKCTPRDCASAPSSTNTNTLCSNWFSNCVTNGSGCVAATTCELTIKQSSCEGTKNCAWQPICTSNSSCTQFKRKAICISNTARVYKGLDDDNNPIYVTQKCGWGANGCQDLECSHLTGAFYSLHANCAVELSTCMSNGVDACITKQECSKLKGTKNTCLTYPGFCTNLPTALETASCQSRLCSDNTEAKDNATCEAWNPGCISNGQGCVFYTTSCSSFKGDRDTCNNLYGYISGSSSNYLTVQCYNDSNATVNSSCKQKICSMATDMSEGSCNGFLKECIYNGNGSCVDPEVATCDDYYGVAAFCEGLTIKNKDPKYCYGTSSAAKCQVKNCDHYPEANTTDEICQNFKSGCIAKSSGGCVDKSATSCSLQSGTNQTCPNFSSNSGKCQKYNQCQDRVCGDILNPTSQQDCINYKSTCRFFKPGSPCIYANICNQYYVQDSTAQDSDKFAYCITITNYNGKFCGYKTGNTCAERTCDQFLSTYTTTLTCLTYVPKPNLTDKNPCKLAGTICYAPQSDCAYPHGIITTDSDKKTECQKYENTNDVQCIWSIGIACSNQNKCENLITQTDAKTCNDFLYATGKGLCQKLSDSMCITTSTDCATYKLDSSKTEVVKKAVCQGLYVIDDVSKYGTGTGVFKKCIYKSADACSPITTCAEVPSAMSQVDCDNQLPGCLYFNGLCYAISETCAGVSIPNNANTDTLKSLFCHSMKQGYDHCKLNAAKNACEDNADTDCTSFDITRITDWDGNLITLANFCGDKADKTKRILCKAGTLPNCSAATCEDIANPKNQGDCDNRILGCSFSNGKCRIFDPAGAHCEAIDIPTDITVASGKTVFCQSVTQTISSNSGVPCTYDEFKSGPADTYCAATGTCSSYTALPSDETQKLTYCLSKVNASKQQCAFTIGQDACRDSDCFDIFSPTSQISCDLGAPGKTCTYIQGTCYNTTDGCDKVPALGFDKKEYCDLLTSNTINCTYIAGEFCTPKLAECKDYDVTNASDKKATCNTLVNQTDEKCIYVWGYKCVTLGTCHSYDGSAIAELGPENGKEITQCPIFKAITTGYPCIKHASDPRKCQTQVCADNEGNEYGCKNNVSGCIYYQNKCISKTSCALYTFPDTIINENEKQSWCEEVIDSNDNKCKYDGTKCANRLCSDSATARYYTDFDCKSYLKTCKTDGYGCIDASSNCNTVSGNQTFCELMLDNSGYNYCKSNAAVVAYGNCQVRTCYDNVSAKSDGDCEIWMKDCVTRGNGCIPKDRPCSEYRGTKTQCEAFKYYSHYDNVNKVDVYVQCSGMSSNKENSKCKDRKCTDNTIATTNDECQAYLDGCVTKGIGCISKFFNCSVYKGTRDTCSNFTGSSGYEYCYNVENATETSNCQKKNCSDIQGTNNKECSDGMKPFNTTDKPFCVFNGTVCDTYGKRCEKFKGTEITCPTYIALNGPCKATNYGTIVGSCAKRVCIEASNNLKTDQECQDYHPDCVTTGYGCTFVVNCNSMINQDSCQLRPECTWANQCEPTKTSCSEQSGTSRSNCVNTVITIEVNNVKIKKNCAWTEIDNQCRDQKCEDQSATINSHKQCNDFDKTCTTTGVGCIIMTVCKGYRTESICKAASYLRNSTTGELGRCFWENNKCRERICGDLNGKTDAECDAHLSGCKTNGTECVYGSGCSDFKLQQYCISSENGPCLWINGICHNYNQCEDALMKSHSECQDFSPLCTTNGERCIPITSCSKTALRISCVIGTDGDCGYLPTGKCQKFNKCADAISNDQNACLAYGGCITDGTTCVAKGKCSDYKTEISCKNNLGSDGVCFWKGSNCKLKECSDLIGTTYDRCRSQVITGGSCTTDGIQCTPLKLCQSYTEGGCYQGTDGTCIFSFPIGQTSGNKACRLKLCEDIDKGVNNFACGGVIPGKECVSNTKNCIPKAACSTYKILEACNGGGLEGINQVQCTFSPNSATDKFNGTCKEFTQCKDANQDSNACSTNKACKWTLTEIASSCVSHTCDTFATGTDCQPVPSFDGKTFTVCIIQNGVCTASDPGTITDSKVCYTKSAQSYTWNQNTNKCEQCRAGATQQNTTNNNTIHLNNTDNYGTILPIFTLSLLGIMA